MQKDTTGLCMSSTRAEMPGTVGFVVLDFDIVQV